MKDKRSEDLTRPSVGVKVPHGPKKLVPMILGAIVVNAMSYSTAMEALVGPRVVDLIRGLSGLMVGGLIIVGVVEAVIWLVREGLEKASKFIRGGETTTLQLSFDKTSSDDFSTGKGMKRCPFCDESIQSVAVKCRYCGEWLQAPARSVNRRESNHG